MIKRIWDWLTKPFRKDPGTDLGGPGPFKPK